VLLEQNDNVGFGGFVIDDDDVRGFVLWGILKVWNLKCWKEERKVRKTTLKCLRISRY